MPNAPDSLGIAIDANEVVCALLAKRPTKSDSSNACADNQVIDCFRQRAVCGTDIWQKLRAPHKLHLEDFVPLTPLDKTVDDCLRWTSCESMPQLCQYFAVLVLLELYVLKLIVGVLPPCRHGSRVNEGVLVGAEGQDRRSNLARITATKSVRAERLLILNDGQALLLGGPRLHVEAVLQLQAM